MTDFGPAIERGCSIWDAGEERPVWLADEVYEVQGMLSGMWYVGPVERCWPDFVAIRLPADHFAYKVKSWNDAHPDEVPFYPLDRHGQAPSGYDGSTVLTDQHEARTGRSSDWLSGPCHLDGDRALHAIGYRRKPQPAPQVEAPVDWSRPIEKIEETGEIIPCVVEDPADADPRIGVRTADGYYLYNQDGSPDYADGSRIRNVAASPDLTAIAQEAAKAAGMVAVKVITAADALEHYSSLCAIEGGRRAIAEHWALKALKDMGIIRPEPTQAERIHASLPHISVADVEAVLGLVEAGK